MQVVGAPALGKGQAGGKRRSWGVQAALQGAGEGAGPGRLALRGRVAHRVLVSTKSLQRRRTGVLLLFSYLQESDTELHTPRQGCDTPWGQPQAVTCAQTPGHQEWEPTPALEPARIVTFPHPHITPSHFNT